MTGSSLVCFCTKPSLTFSTPLSCPYQLWTSTGVSWGSTKNSRRVICSVWGRIKPLQEGICWHSCCWFNHLCFSVLESLHMGGVTGAERWAWLRSGTESFHAEAAPAWPQEWGRVGNAISLAMGHKTPSYLGGYAWRGKTGLAPWWIHTGLSCPYISSVPFPTALMSQSTQLQQKMLALDQCSQNPFITLLPADTGKQHLCCSSLNISYGKR